MEKLIIVESANKITAIKKYIQELQKEGVLDKKDNYEIEATVGHILELPSRWIPRCGETEWGFEKKTILGKGKLISALRQAAKKADLVLIATDPDREGEAIANDVVQKLKIQDKSSRISFEEITKEALGKSILNPRKIDEDMVRAQETRLLLDRVMGYRLSTWVKSKIWNDFNKKSAGRVQSPTLKLVVERELLIEGFNPIPYIKIEQEFPNEIIAEIVLKDKNVDNKSNLLDVQYLDEVKKTLTGKLKVKEVSTKTVSGSRKIPFKQSAVYKSSGTSAASARNSMQKLFESGLITYPRTDSTKYSQTFINIASKFIKDKFGEAYLASSIRGTKTKVGEQGAHEALRVTDLNKTPDKVPLTNSAEIKMYKLIYNHTLQTLMTPPKREVLTYLLDDNGYNFKMSSSKVLFDGYLKVVGYSPDQELPVLKQGDEISSLKINYIEGETKPKARYNEGSLISKMEEVGIGRPSTFSSTVKILKDRKYIVVEKRAIRATPLGKAVILALIIYFDKIINESYTKELELELDKIALGEKDGKEFLTSFYNHLCQEISTSIIKKKAIDDEKTTIIDINAINNTKTKDIPSDRDVYSKTYCDLIRHLEQHYTVNNKEIKIDYPQFVKTGQEHFMGHVLMPLPPRQVKTFIKVNNKYLPFDKSQDYPDAEICEKCNKFPWVYRSSIKRKERAWFKACSGFPRCKNSDAIKEKENNALEQEFQKVNKDVEPVSLEELFRCDKK